jgi:NADH-quinone oxidoreductase subunit M
LAAIGVILAAVYILFMFQKLFLGPLTNKKNEGLKDLSLRELAIMVPLLVMIFWIGLYPKPFFDLMAPTVDNLVQLFQSGALALH